MSATIPYSSLSRPSWSVSELPDGSYTYSYGPTGLKGLLHSRSSLVYGLFASIGGLTFGYDQGVIATVLVAPAFINAFPVSTWQKGLITAVLELGALLGSLVAGTLSERISRTGAICVACAVFCVGSLFQCLATTIEHLIIGRAVGGIGVGALSMLCPLYLAEISSPELRGTMMVIEQVSIVFGVVVGYWLGFFTQNVAGSWRIPLAAQLVPGALLGFGSMRLPQSPRLLIMKGKTDDGLEVLRQLRTSHSVSAFDSDLEQLVKLEALEIQVEVQLIHELESERAGSYAVKGGIKAELNQWLQLFEPRYLRRVMIGVTVMFFQQWSGVNALIYYAPSLMRPLGFDTEHSNVVLIAAGFVSIAQFLAVWPAISLIDKIGRRGLLMTGALIMASSHGTIALCTWVFHSSWAEYPLAGWTAIGCIYIFTFAYGVSFGPCGWVLPSEVIPLEIRGRGVALSTASNWINNFIIGLATPKALELSPTTTYATFALCCCAGYFWSKHYLPETMNVSLEEMARVFQDEAYVLNMAHKQEIQHRIGLSSIASNLCNRMDTIPHESNE